MKSSANNTARAKQGMLFLRSGGEGSNQTKATYFGKKKVGILLWLTTFHYI
jgi:hypothetical protein